MAFPGFTDAVSTDFAAAVRCLKQRLARPLPGHAAQLRMAPPARTTSAQVSVEGKTCREAGVLALLYPGEEDRRPLLVLTERRDHLDDHAGQVSFPGGRREEGESLQGTALREAREEIALDARRVEVLGPLTPLYIPPSAYCVHPFVGITRSVPALHPADAEVATLLHVPLALLLDPGTLARKPWDVHGRTVEVPFYDVPGHPPIWGATAMMLAELLALFGAVGDQGFPSEG